MPLNMNTIGMGNSSGNSSGGIEEFVSDPIYTEYLNSNISDISNIEMSVIEKPLVSDKNIFDIYKRGPVPGFIEFNGEYLNISRISDYNIRVYKTTVTETETGYAVSNTVLSLPCVRGMCKFQDKVLFIGSDSSTTNIRNHFFYTFDGMSFTKLSSTSIIDYVGEYFEPMMGYNTYSILPVPSENGEFDGYFFIESIISLSGYSDPYKLFAYFQIKDGDIRMIKYIYDSYRSQSSYQIFSILNGITSYCDAGTIEYTYFTSIDNITKILINSNTKEIVLRPYKWIWRQTPKDHLNGATFTQGDDVRYTLTGLKSTGNTKGKFTITNFLSYHNSYLVSVYYSATSSTDNRNIRLTDMLMVKIGSNNSSSIVDLNFKSYNKNLIENVFNFGADIVLQLQLNYVNPYMLVRAYCGDAVIIKLNVSGDYDSTGSVYECSTYFERGDTVLSDDGIISYTHNDQTVNLSNTKSFTIPESGVYLFKTLSSNAYKRPAFVILDKNGSILHLDVTHISENLFSGYFLKDMKVNDMSIANSGYNEIKQEIPNQRIRISIN